MKEDKGKKKCSHSDITVEPGRYCMKCDVKKSVTPQALRGWEERFDEQYIPSQTFAERKEWNKSFISSTLKEQEIAQDIKCFDHCKSTLDTYKAGLRKKVDGMKQEGKSEFQLGSEFSTPRDYRRSGYNQALSDVIALLS